MTSDTHTGAEINILTMKDLVVVRGDQRLIDHVSATVTRGHITLLLGHNGAGKTVLMNCLHGLMTVDSGHIYAPPQQRQKMVFQKPIMLRRSARQYLKFLCPELDTQQLSGWLARAGLSHRTDTPARALSGGEQQRLALARCVLRQPMILFLDEATSAIGKDGTLELFKMLRQ